jgi:hypothetical protein
MSTGITTWNTNLLDIGPLYPFVGSEMLLVSAAIAVWLIWHFLQARAEAREAAELKPDPLHALEKENQRT